MGNICEEKMNYDPTYKNTQKKTKDGGKARHIDSTIDRIYHYRKFRDTIGAPPYPCDIDFVEYVFDENGNVVPVAILEITTLNFEFPHDQARDLFLKKVWTRWSESDAQKKFILKMAKLLNVTPYLVVIPPTPNEKPEIPPPPEVYVHTLWITKISSKERPKKWIPLPANKYKEFIESLGE